MSSERNNERFLPDITANAARTLSAAGYGARECEILQREFQV